jgi:hypothetical protein
MAEPSSKSDQPPAAETPTGEDAATRLNQILASPIDNPFAPEPKPEVPPEFAAWQGANPSPPEAAPKEAPTAPPEPSAAEAAVPAEPPPAGASPAAPATESAPAPSVAVAAAPPASAVAEAAAGSARPREGAAADAGAAGVIAKVRRLMLISTVLTALAIAAVFGIIGYRVFQGQGRQEAPNQATLTLPAGAKIVQTAIADDRIVLTLQIGGALEIRTYDLKTLKPLGRLTFSSVP